MSRRNSRPALRAPMRTAGALAHLRDDRGLTTAEYAVGTIAAAGLGGLLIKLVTSDEARNLIWSLLSRALSIVLG